MHAPKTSLQSGSVTPRPAAARTSAVFSSRLPLARSVCAWPTLRNPPRPWWYRSETCLAGSPVDRLGIPEANVDDATQQVFCVAARRIDEIAPGSERSFLFGTAVRVASDDRRSAHHREQPDGELDRHISPGPDPEDMAEKNRRRRLLDEVLRSMPIELRAILVLFELEQMTKSEVAELLGIPEGTCVSRLRRARKEFQNIARRRIARDGFIKVGP
jgi:RNA polymerase sigma-70 factor, ECF subfamily